MSHMSSFKNYAIQARYQWILDNELTPQVVIHTTYGGVTVPDSIKGPAGALRHKTMLCISAKCTRALVIDLKQNLISFMASFNGVIEHVSFPFDAVEQIFARETGEGDTFAVDYSNSKNFEKLPKLQLRIVK